MRTRHGRERSHFIGILFFSIIYNVAVIGNAVMYGWRAAGLTVVAGVCVALAEGLMEDV